MALPTPNKAAQTPFLTLRQVSLRYRQVSALQNVNLTLRQGEIHALVGEHGAGKSSLCYVLAGLVKPDAGQIYIKQTPYSALTPKLARQYGIECVDQQSALFENLSVAENLFVTKEAQPSSVYNHKKLLLKAAAYLAELGVSLQPAQKLQGLDLSDRSLIDILKHIYLQPQLLILDETLDKLKTETLHKVVALLNTLKQQGSAILFITHRIDEIYQIADMVSVIKDGEIFVSDSVQNLDKINLIKFAYTQITSPSRLEITKAEFYQLLKYNEAILQHLPVNLLVIDNDLQIKLLNERARSFFQAGHADYYNRPLEHVLQPQNREVYALIRQAVAERQAATFYNVTIAMPPAQKKNHITINPIYDGAFLIGTLLIIEDISEQEKLREQVVFSEKLASTGLLAAGVAHEINNPLEIMHNYLEYLKYEIQTPKLLEIIEILRHQTEAIAQIVSNLMIFSDQANANLETFDLNTLIERIIELIRHNARHKQIAIHLTSAAPALALHANKTEIQQVLLNLLKNSFEAMPSGGEIFIATALVPEQGANLVEMTFRDTGTGIGDDNPNNIFLPFYSTKKGQANNLGLGLSVSYGIIKKYNGTITVENIENAGCQFTIRFPQAA